MNILQRIINLFASKEEEVSEIDQLIAHVEKPAHREIYETVLKNQLTYLKSDTVGRGQECPHCHKHIPSKENVANLLPKLAVKVLDQIIILDDIIGIQPMQGPVGLAYKIRYRTTDQEGGEGKGTRFSLEVISQAIEAKSRKFAAGWTVEASNDMTSQHGKDLENEILLAVASEMAYEIIDEILCKIGSKATPIHLKSFLEGPRLALHINQTANNIAKATRRGAGNFVIADPITVSLLQSSKEFEKHDDGNPEGFLRLRHVGTLNGTIRVYCDMLADGVIVGYKGSTATDTGLIYSPYTLLMATGPIMDPMTFQPKMTFMTRYGDDMDEAAEGYYHTLAVHVDTESSLDELLLEEAS